MEEDDEAVWFWAVQAGLVIRPVRWARVAQFSQVGYSLLLFSFSLSFSFISVFLLCFFLNYNLFCRFSNLGVILYAAILLLVQYAVF
jgi:hypothetical protein